MAEASGVRRSWLTAAQQRGAELVGLRNRDGRGGLFGQSLLTQRQGRLYGECLHDAAVPCLQRGAPQDEHEVVVDGHIDVAGAGRGARRIARALRHGPARAGWACASRSSRVTESSPNDSRSWSSSAGSGREPRSTLPATTVSALASPRARTACWVRRTARSTVALTATATSRNTTRASTFSVSAMVSVPPVE